MVIAFDLDDILSYHVETLAEWHNENYGTNLTIEDFKTHNFWMDWGGTKEEAIQKVIAFFNSDHGKKTKVMAGAKEGIDYLKQREELVITTAKLDELKQHTLDWVNENFPGCFSQVLFTNNLARNDKPLFNKTNACLKLNVKFIVEDRMKEAEPLARAGIRVLMLRKPWNVNREIPEDLKDNIEIFDDWSQMLERMKQILVNH